MAVSDRKAAHAARRAAAARQAYAAAGSPQERLRVAYDWFRAASLPDRTVDAVARRLAAAAGRADARRSGRATRPSGSGEEPFAA